MATREGSSLERTMTEGNTHYHEVPPSQPHLLNSPPIGDFDVAGPLLPCQGGGGKRGLSHYGCSGSGLRDTLNNEIVDLKWQISDLRSEMFVVETTASKAETRHHLEIEAANVAMVDEQKDKILKLASDSYNLCLKKMAKAFLEIDTEVLDHIEFFDVESEDFEEDEVFEDLVAPTDP
ncbi:hypothetical protein F0562_019544 [Nyssa sinensis]|uniref:Uncharacterized protein n=1 Tax=Nyssa sinensis TaxID=561372 RepID=A0A5J5BSP1_9ASTE|nr:hypothetical protein F0562_019544 [Nyssa sinensis]